MSRARWVVAVLAVLLLVVPVLAFQAKEKKKPADARSINDKKGEVTQVADGATAKVKIEVKNYLDVEGWFDKDGLNITGLNADGPGAHLMSPDGGEAAMEPGDIIVEIDGKKVTTPKEYADALNTAMKPDKVKLKVKDVNTGNDQEFYAATVKRG